MHRASVGDLDQPLPLGVLEIALDHKNSFDYVDDLPGLFAAAAVRTVIALVCELDVHVVQWPLLVIRVHANRHRGASTERGEQELIGVGAGIVAASVGRLVGEPAMIVGFNRAQEPRVLFRDADTATFDRLGLLRLGQR